MNLPEIISRRKYPIFFIGAFLFLGGHAAAVTLDMWSPLYGVHISIYVLVCSMALGCVCFFSFVLIMGEDGHQQGLIAHVITILMPIRLKMQ